MLLIINAIFFILFSCLTYNNTHQSFLVQKNFAKSPKTLSKV